MRDSWYANSGAIQARQEALRWRRDSIDRAVQRLHEGLSVVGESADLYAALGHAHLQYREAGLDLGATPLEMADSYVEKVFEVAPDSVAGLRLRGWVHYSRGGIQQAVRDLKMALESNWSDADTLGLLSNCYLISGRVPAARPWIRRLMEVDPLTPLTRCMPGWADVLEGDFASALGPYRTMHEMDPDNPMGRLFYAHPGGAPRRFVGIESTIPEPGLLRAQSWERTSRLRIAGWRQRGGSGVTVELERSDRRHGLLGLLARGASAVV